MTQTPPLTDAQVDDAWRRFHAKVDGIVTRGQTETLWNVDPGTALAGDDKRTHPWSTSHAAAAALLAALDHLHALGTSVMSPTPVLHNSAPYTLVRGALENAATALWIVHPSSRPERITRTLRWYANDARDGDTAKRAVGLPLGGKPLREHIAELGGIAVACGCDPVEATRNIVSTEMLKYADPLSPNGSVSPLFIWRLCSGFAHGRMWASLGLLDREVTPTAHPEVSHMRQTNTLTKVLSIALAGLELFDLASTTFEERAKVR